MHIGLVIIVMMSIGANACAASSVGTAFNVEPSRVLHRQDNNGYTYVLKDSSVFVAQEGGVGAIVSATLFFNGTINKEALVKRMLWMLGATNAPPEFRDWARKTLPDNWRLEKDGFVLPLQSEKYGTHEFTYTNTGHNQLYILTYRRLDPAH